MAVNLSPVVDLAWQLACVEAAAAQFQFIEPEHFLAALAKLQQLSTGEAADLARAEGIDVDRLRPEMELVGVVMAESAVDPDTFRYELRERLGKGAYDHGKCETIHRSGRSRKTFDRAEALVRETSADEMKTGHLFLAILEEKDSLGCRLLVEKCACNPSAPAGCGGRKACGQKR
jgi:ATP-dependent Clp protease ATP-binding subunit ClpA